MTTTQLPDHLVASPGDFLDEWLTDRALTQVDFAQRFDVSTKFLNQLIKGKATLTPDMATRLETITKVSAETWLNIEAAHQAAAARTSLLADLSQHESLVEREFVKSLREAGHITAPTRDKGQLVRQLLSFFEVATPDALGRRITARQAAFRTTTTAPPNPYAVEAWLCIAEQDARHIDTAPFNKSALKRLIPTLRGLSTLSAAAYSVELRERLSACGVALVYVPPVAGSRCAGVTLWRNKETAIVALSLRGKTDDTFWFTLFHELHHVLNGYTSTPRLHSPGAHDTSYVTEEAAADAFSSSVLIPPADAQELSAIVTLDDATEFARNQGISPGIVVGRLQHDGLKPYTWGNGLKQRLTFADA